MWLFLHFVAFRLMVADFRIDYEYWRASCCEACLVSVKKFN